jgi:N-acetylneuraminic acid mutarotase
MKRLFAILSLFVATTGYCQDNWVLKTPVNKPLMRTNHSMAPIGGDKVLLFGGLPGSINDETWVYDLSDNTWTFMNPSVKPSPRSGHAMANIGGDQVLLFGGTDAAGFNGETWIYDLSKNKWTLLNPVKKPSPRVFHAMANIGSDKVLLFGGNDAGGFDGETWVYDLSDNNWTEKITSVKPSARARHAMAFIRGSFSDQVMLFGGTGTGGLNNETWIYNGNGNNWTLKTPLTKPLKRSFHAMATYQGDKVLMFGGSITNNSSGLINDTWEYDYTDDKWTSKNPVTKPFGRTMHALSLIGNTVLLFGGLDVNGLDDETWVYGEITAPVINCPANITIGNATNQCAQGVPFTVTATGNPAPTVVCMLDDHIIFSHHFFPVGTRTVNCFATNGIGDTAKCSFTVTVEDRSAPVITCPADIVVNPSTLQGAIVNYPMPVATDNCTVTLTQTGGIASGGLFPIGTTLIEFAATDAAGNRTNCNFKITVTDPHCGEKKVNVCENGTTSCVDEEDLPKLLGRGATLGACPNGGRVRNTVVAKEPAKISTGYALENYPNPFRVTTNIRYTIAKDARVSLAVYDPLGQKLAQLVNGRVTAGNHAVQFNASSLTAGVYYYKLSVNGGSEKNVEVIKKMILIK